MASQDTKVQFSAQGLQEIKSSAIGLLRDLVSYTEKYNKESQKTLDLLKEQISLLGERNKSVGVSGQPIDLSNRGTNDQSFSLLVEELKSFKDENKQGTSSIISQLKEVSEVLKNFNLTGNISGTIGKKILSATIGLGLNGGIGGTGTGGGEGESEGTSEQKEGKGQAGKSKDSPSSVWTRDLYKLAELMTGALNSEDYVQVYTKSMSTLATTLAGNGVLGAAVGLPLMVATMGAQTLIDLYDERQKAAQGNVQLFGGSLKGTLDSTLMRSLLSSEKPYNKLGYSYLDIMSERERISPSIGRKASEDDIWRSLLLQKGAGLDSSVVNSLFRVLRGGKVNATEVVGGVIRGQRLGDDYSLLNENLQLLVGISEKQLQELGTTNITLNNQILSGLSKISSDFKNPQVLSSVYQKTVEGSQRAKTDQFQALQYRTLDQVARESGMKNYSVWDLTKIMENPNDPKFGKFMTTLMNNLYKNLGEQNFEMVLQSQYGYGIPMINRFTEAMRRTGGNMSMVDYTGALTDVSSTLQGRASQATTSLEQRSSEYKDTKGIFLSKGLDEVAEKTIETMQDLNDAILGTVSVLSQGIKDLKKTFRDKGI